MTVETTPIRVRFVGAAGQFNSIATQAVRVHNGLVALGDPRVESKLTLLPVDTFATVRRRRSRFRVPGWINRQLSRLVAGTDILIVVKSALLAGFPEVACQLRDLCRANGVVLVSSPADGPESSGLGKGDTFSEELADFVFTISKAQHEILVEQRGADVVRYVGAATRPTAGAQLEVRDQVKSVIWENPPHYDPFAKPELNGTPKEQHEAFERYIAGLCEKHGARLVTFGFWRDQQDDHEWEQTLLAADVAIECKSLENQYTSYQLQKPPVKLQNYLTLGMPTICDSLPGHLDVGKPAGVLFADTLGEWADCLEKLFASRELRLQMSQAGKESVRSSSIEAVAIRYVDSFLEMRSAAVSARQAI